MTPDTIKCWKNTYSIKNIQFIIFTEKVMNLYSLSTQEKVKTRNHLAFCVNARGCYCYK